MKQNRSGDKDSRKTASEPPAANTIHGQSAAASVNPPDEETGNHSGTPGVTAGTDRVNEATRTAEPRLRGTGSSKGYAADAGRDSVTGVESYQHTGSENREGMRSGSSSGTHRRGRTKR